METNHFLYIYIFLVFLRDFLVEKTILFLDTFSPCLPLLSGMAHSECDTRKLLGP